MLLLPTFHNNFECFICIGTLLLILFCIQSTSIAQDDTTTNPPPILTAAKLTGTPPRIDGNLDEDVWKHAPVATGFVQLLPADVDADGTPELVRNPDFNFKQFRSNVVLRWEYRLGSTLFVVWSQGRQHIDPMGEFNLGSDLGTLFDAPAENVFMIKLNYWLNPHEVLQK